MLLGTCLGLAVHVIVTCGITNRPLIHAAEGQSSISVFEVYGLSTSVSVVISQLPHPTGSRIFSVTWVTGEVVVITLLVAINLLQL